MALARTAAAYGAASPPASPRSPGSCARASGSPAPRCTTWRPAREFDVRARQIVNATGVWTDDTQALVGERGQFHVRASKGIHLVVPRDRIHSATGLILRTEKSRALRHPVGPALDHRHHRHRLGRSTRPTRRPAGPTSTTCSTTSTGARHAADPRGRRGRLRRAAAAARRRVRVDQPSCPASTPSPTRPRPGGGGRRQVHDLPGHGQGRRRRGRRRRTSAASAPSAVTEQIPLLGAEGYARAVEPAPRRSPQRAGLHVARVEHLLHRYGSLHRRGARPRRRATRARRAARRARTTTCGPRSSTRPRTRAPGTSTTC